MLLVSINCTTCARNHDKKLGNDGFGANKQAGIKFELLLEAFMSITSGESSSVNVLTVNDWVQRIPIITMLKIYLTATKQDCFR